MRTHVHNTLSFDNFSDTKYRFDLLDLHVPTLLVHFNLDEVSSVYTQNAATALRCYGRVAALSDVR